MRVLCCLCGVIVWALSGRASDADLTKIDRTLRNEPTYQSKAPQYCLLVFGPETQTRVWLVLDGDALYLDRNGNGDLTDPGERLAPQYALHRPANRPDAEVLRSFDFRRPSKFPHETDDAPILTCGPEITWLHVFQFLPREDYQDQDLVRRQKDKPIRVALTTKTGHGQSAQIAFADRPQDAPILHFDGPLRLALETGYDPPELRRGETSELYVRLVTPGLNATVTTDHDDIPEVTHPVAEIEFPPRRPGGEPPRLRVELKERC